MGPDMRLSLREAGKQSLQLEIRGSSAAAAAARTWRDMSQQGSTLLMIRGKYIR